MSALLLESFPSAAAIVDHGCRALESNGLWNASFSSPLTLEDPLAQGLLEHNIAEVLGGKLRRSTPIVHVWKGRWYQSRVSALVDRTDGVLLTHEDVTSFKRAQPQARELLEATSGAVGPSLLKAITRQLSRITGARYAWVGILDPENVDAVQLVALWDAVLQRYLPDLTCPLGGTPCEGVVGKMFSLFPSGVQQRFPRDPLLVEWKLEGYLGMALTAPDGAPIGVIAAGHTSALDSAIDPQLIHALANRAGSELARSRAEEALRQSQQRLKLALEGSDDGLFDWDIVTGKVRGNPRLSQMLGYAPSQLESIDAWNALAHPEDRDRVAQAVTDHLKGVTAEYRTELRLRQHDGSYRWILDRGKVVERDAKGRALRMTGLHSDIEERKRLEAQVQISGRMASVGTLAATLAHELNTPLSYLATGLSALEAAAEPKARQEALKMAHDGAERIAEVVRDAKMFSHVDSQAVLSEVDLAEVIERAVRLARHVVERRGKLEVSVGPLPPAWAHAAQLSHVVLNLLVNAAQALPNDGGQHRVQVRAGTDARGWICVEVEDSGKGIGPETASRVFEPFFTTRPAGEGTGLGLAICQNVVRSLGGEISFTSQPGSTIFKVVLPPAVAAPVASKVVPPAEPTPTAKGLRVLVIDDHPSMGISLKLMLRGEHDVDSVTSAMAGYALLESSQYDVVLCDLMMPGVTGVDLYRKVAERLPAVAPRFVFMTGGTTSSTVRSFVESTQRKVLEKPFGVDALRAVLTR